MVRIFSSTILLLCCLCLGSCRSTEKDAPAGIAIQEPIDPLPSWRASAALRIKEWVKASTDTGSQHFIPVADRIAVFDNDGTLWPEQPFPNQLQFAFDQIQQLSKDHPEWLKDPVIKGIVDGNFGPLQNAGLKGAAKVVGLTHTGMNTQEFNTAVKKWIDTAKDKRFKKPFREVVYQPMIELLAFLRLQQFQIFIVSGGGADFMRPWTEDVYGIPPYHVIGSYGELTYDIKDGKPVISKVKGDIYVDDKTGKPIAIHRFIGKIPVFCGGNSDGDQAMMQYTSSSPYRSLCLLVRHTDEVREFAYEKKTLSGHLETALVEATEKKWMVVDMKQDWKKVFDFQ